MFKTIKNNGSIFVVMLVINITLIILTCSFLYAAWATGEFGYSIGVIASGFLTLFFTQQNFKNNENKNV